LALFPQGAVVPIERGGLGRVGVFLFHAGGRAIRSVGVGGMHVEKERLVAMPVEPGQDDSVESGRVRAAVGRVRSLAVDHRVPIM
jgi:hypothetical protein